LDHASPLAENEMEDTTDFSRWSFNFNLQNHESQKDTTDFSRWTFNFNLQETNKASLRYHLALAGGVSISTYKNLHTAKTSKAESEVPPAEARWYR